MQPYGTNDAGGFRNVLPPGENGLDTLAQIFSFRGIGDDPASLRRPAAALRKPRLRLADPDRRRRRPLLQGRDLRRSRRRGRLDDRTEARRDDRPRLGLRRPAHLRRHARRHDVRRRLRGRRGPALPDGRPAPHRPRRTRLLPRRRPTPAPMPRSGASPPTPKPTWNSSSTQMPQHYGAAGQQAVEDVQSYVDGINAYIAAANINPSLKPGEYSLLSKPMEPWKPTDVVAIASLIGGIFGRGGGNELNSALTMQSLVKRFGKKAGRKAWLGFRSKNDPEAPTTISKPFPYETRSAFAKRGLALPEPGSVRETPIATASSGAVDAGRRLRRSHLARPARRRPRLQLGAGLGQALGDRPPDRGDGAAGRLLRPPDPDGGGPARARHRRPRRRLRRRQPLRRARPRPRLRLERDHGDLRQRRHLRRGPLQGQVPLPLPRQVQADGKAAEDGELGAERDRLDRSRARRR